ncbi:MAG: hypothetical protein ACYDEJ_06160 [Desulfitobacteriaceae bacterium]
MKDIDESIWQKKGETLSDASARKEFGIKREDIIDGIREGKLQYKDGNMHGNPWFRLLRYEVEALVVEIFGDKYLDEIKIKNELAQILKEEKSLKRQIVLLEKRKAELLGKLDVMVEVGMNK